MLRICYNQEMGDDRMKKLKLWLTREHMQKIKALRISRSDRAYAILNGEYPNLPRDMEGNMIVPGYVFNEREFDQPQENNGRKR